MYQLSPCLELLFTEAGAEPANRIHAAAAAGFTAVEFWTWRDKNVDDLQQALHATGISLQTICTDPMTRIVDPTTHETFLNGLRESITVAERLNSPYLVVTAGDTLPGVSPASQREAVVNVLESAATLLEGHPVTLLLENLNSRVDHVGTFLDATSDVISILRDVGSSRLKLLYDAYHSLVMKEDPTEVLDGNMDLLGHIQIADTPGRGEPGTGTDDWSQLLHTFRKLGYDGRIGLEYFPTTDTKDSLSVIRTIAAQE